jgi:cellulose synthase/poly-beta-1,6-N-acetylglucosamine synthase-like glycosyltransferase
MHFVPLLCIVLSLLLAAPVAVYCLEVLAGCLPERRQTATKARRLRPRLAVIVPAHDEQAGIVATLRSIQSQLEPGDRLLVVADNCTDQTAEVARTCGAIVLERRDESRRGKGFALAFGLESLAADPPSVVLFFDADCRLAPQTIDTLACEAQNRLRPVQALYLCEPTSAGGPQQRLSALAFRFKNLIRAAGLSRLGGSCHLTGSGMALPWQLVQSVPWASGNLVEDMQLGIDFALAGFPPQFISTAHVHSDLPVSNGGQLAQRRRWEHGFLQTALNQSPALLLQALRRRAWPLMMLGLDLTVPPLALLSVGLLVGWLVALAVWLIGCGVMPLVLMTLSGCSFATATLLGWAIHCRDLAPAGLLLQIPNYFPAKLSLYAEFLTRRERRWVRTERAR